ncbi:hypothetical protein IKE84_00860 [Candidatus Saccharibacteria bacterium]|nr:hypothetical protein [Candidatus Saccharibacteria bacterium]
MPRTNSRNRSFRESFKMAREKQWGKKRGRPSTTLHRSFRRSYREDYNRDIEMPGLFSHAIKSFKLIIENWKLFLPLILLMTISSIILVGLMNEDVYVQFQKSIDETSKDINMENIGTFTKSGLLLVSAIATGGLTQGKTEVQQVFTVLIFLIIWLVTIYILRHRLSGQIIKLRDGLYNALAPLLSTLVVALVIFVETIPIMIVVIAYSAAVRTDFLSTPFYALIFFIFAALLTILSVYLVSSSLVALVSVSAPGLYPMIAIKTASDLLAGRRIKFIIRVIYLAIIMIIFWVVIMLPLIALDLWLKSVFDWLAGIPFVSLELLLMTCFTAVYATTYLYLYYRRLLDYEE